MKKVALAAAAMLCASSASAQSLTVLEPASNWVMNYDDDSCALQRQFGEEGSQAFLELRQFGSGDQSVQVTIASEDFKRRDGDFSVAVTPLESRPTDRDGFNIRLSATYEGKMFIDQVGANSPGAVGGFREFVIATPLLTDEQRQLVLQGFDHKDDVRVLPRLLANEDYQNAARIANAAYQDTPTYLVGLTRARDAIEGIQIKGGFDRELYLHTGSLRAPMQAMGTCLDELLSHWGVNVEAHRTLSRPVTPRNLNEFARQIQRTYPQAMLARRLEGFLRVRLDVSAEGQPTACHLQSPINDETFNRIACDQLMRTARFLPALDVNGQPIASYYRTAIVYKLQL